MSAATEDPNLLKVSTIESSSLCSFADSSPPQMLPESISRSRALLRNWIFFFFGFSLGLPFNCISCIEHFVYTRIRCVGVLNKYCSLICVFAEHFEKQVCIVVDLYRAESVQMSAFIVHHCLIGQIECTFIRTRTSGDCVDMIASIRRTIMLVTSLFFLYANTKFYL